VSNQDKRLTKEDVEFKKLLVTVHSLLTFDAYQFFSYLPSLFHVMPRWLMGAARKEKEREFFYQYVKVSYLITTKYNHGGEEERLLDRIQETCDNVAALRH
jgi:hypothetical protein